MSTDNEIINSLVAKLAAKDKVVKEVLVLLVKAHEEAFKIDSAYELSIEDKDDPECVMEAFVELCSDNADRAVMAIHWILEAIDKLKGGA